MDAARIPREATRDLSAVYSIFGLDLPSFVRRVRGKICMLSINRLKVNNSTQLNFTSPTGKATDEQEISPVLEIKLIFVKLF